MLYTILVIVSAVLAAAIVVLRVVAPLTKSSFDDKVLADAEKAEKFVQDVESYVGPASGPKPPTAKK